MLQSTPARQAWIPQLTLHGPLPQLTSPTQPCEPQLMSQLFALLQSIVLRHDCVPQRSLQLPPLQEIAPVHDWLALQSMSQLPALLQSMLRHPWMPHFTWQLLAWAQSISPRQDWAPQSISHGPLPQLTLPWQLSELLQWTVQAVALPQSTDDEHADDPTQLMLQGRPAGHRQLAPEQLTTQVNFPPIVAQELQPLGHGGASTVIMSGSDPPSRTASTAVSSAGPSRVAESGPTPRPSAAGPSGVDGASIPDVSGSVPDVSTLTVASADTLASPPLPASCLVGDELQPSSSAPKTSQLPRWSLIAPG